MAMPQGPRHRRLIIYCDESETKGRYFSHFYGGAAVDVKKRDHIEAALRTCMVDNKIQGTAKWTKIGPGHEDRYMALMDTFFDFVKGRLVKVRIMFLQNMYVAKGLEDYHWDNQYYILYYQFIKHAFGLQCCNPRRDLDTYISLLFDRLPDQSEKRNQFRDYIASLNAFPLFRANRVRIDRNDIAEVNEEDHAIAQCLDVVLGSMQFRLNDLHKEKPKGSKRRGKRTIAKEKVYKHINKRIRDLYPGFNVGVSTARPEVDSVWRHEYRHWRFRPANADVDASRVKPK